MSKKKNKIHLEKEVKRFAKKRGLEENNVLELWKEILENEEINEMDESHQDGERIKLLKVKITEQQTATKPTQIIVGVVVGIDNERIWNVDIIKQMMDAYTKNGVSPTDDEGRPRVVLNKSGDPEVIAYSKKGNPYQLRVRKERNMIFYGSPEDIDADDELISLKIGGEVKIDGKRKFLLDQIDSFPRGKKIRMMIEISDKWINIAKNPINNNGYFDIIDNNVDYDELFDEVKMQEEFVEFDDIDDYISSHLYTPFWTEAVVASIGEPGDYDSVPVSFMPEPSGSFDDDDDDSKTMWIPEEIVINYKLRSTVRLCMSGYIKKLDQSVAYNVSGIYPINPIEISEGKKLKKKAKKKTTNEIDLFD